MSRKNKLVNKVKRLIRRLGMPRWLHRYGPKTYEFYEHLSALMVRFFCRLSFRRVKQILDLLGIRCPSKSALHYTSKKLDQGFWSRVLKVTCGSSYLIAIDSTGLSRTNSSYHYLRRIDGKMPKVPVKLSIAFDTRKKKFAAAKIRVLPAHDIQDATFLIKKSSPKLIVADRAYDASWLHSLCSQQGAKAHIPMRNYGNSKARMWSPRRLAQKHFNKRTYHRRELAESGNSSLKRKMGSSVSSRTVRTIHTEVYGRLACHNIFSYLREWANTVDFILSFAQGVQNYVLKCPQMKPLLSSLKTELAIPCTLQAVRQLLIL